MSAGTETTGARVARQLFGAVVRPLQQFLRLQAASGIVLLASAAAALIWANADPGSYRWVLERPIAVAVGDVVARARDAFTQAWKGGNSNTTQ